MKRLLLLLTLVVLFTGCQQEDQMATTEAVEFTLGVLPGDNPHTIADFPDYVSVEMTVESAGEMMVKSITFRKTEEMYVSEPVEMHSGEYKVIDFVIATENLVSIPGLFNRFAVSRNDAKKNFFLGHAAFQSRGARPLVIAVYTEYNGKRKLTDAKLTIYHNEGESYVYNLSAKIHHIVFKGDPYASYTLKIEKEGYEVYANTFVYSQLEKKRIAITLQEKSGELAVTFEPSATLFSMWLQVTGKGSLILNWGQGETELLEFDVDPEDPTGTAYFFRDQAYGTSIPPATMSGDVHLLTGIFFESAVDALHVQDARGLQGITIIDSNLPTLDLRFNSELTSLYFINSNIVELILPVQHRIRDLFIQPVADWTEWPSISDIDYIISNIHVNAVDSNLYNGSVILNNAPVSEQTESKLTELQNTYGWAIWY